MQKSLSSEAKAIAFDLFRSFISVVSGINSDGFFISTQLGHYRKLPEIPGNSLKT
jgi:hypothetical protein